MHRLLSVVVAMMLFSGVGIASATAAPSVVPSWSVVSSVSPPGAPSGEIEDVACPSATSCFAVGGYINGALAEHWDGVSWTIMSFPYTGSYLSRIACPSTTTCFAIGLAVPMIARWDGTTWSVMSFPGVALGSVACSSDTSCFVVGMVGASTLIEQWDGTTWSRVPSPNLAGATSSALHGVSCASATDCVAVGGSGTHIALIEQWDGTTWSIVPSPNPVGDLVGVSCSSDTSCFAVGASTLIEQWDGTTWSIVASPNVPGILMGISCSSPSSCFAVGVLDSLSGVSPFIDQWDGTSWSVSPTPVVGPYGHFRGVGCASPTNCFAVGDVGGVDSSGLIEHWDGTSWSATADPVANPTPSNAKLGGVSCATATMCFGVGHYTNSYTNSEGNALTLIERPTGTSWAVVASPNRTGVSMLSSVSCPSATMCFAVGESGPGGAWRTLIERWDGRTWSIMASPNVSERSGVPPNVLLGVSCSSASNCYAVGYSHYYALQTVIEHWDGKTWTLVPSPNRSQATTAESELEGVSCTSRTSCVAVGRSSSTNTNHPDTYRTLTERWNGKTWAIVPSPNAVSGAGELAAVSCARPILCVAVGSAYKDSLRQSLIETWNGTTWTRTASADPTSATTSVLSGVSCTSPTSCVAVGNDSGTSQQTTTLVKTLASGHWTITPSATPTGARNSSLNAVSCTNTTTCTAVGSYDTNGAPLTLVERHS